MTEMRLTFENGKFVTAGTLLPQSRERLKADPYWSRIEGDRFATASIGAARVFRGVLDDSVKKIFKRLFQEHYPLSEEIPAALRAMPLDPHQREGVEWVLSRKRSYLAHAPGAGKTCEAVIAACLARGTGQTLFIVPPGLTKNWEREIWKFTEWAGVFPTIGIVGRSDSQETVAWGADFILCPDSMLTKTWVHANIRSRRWKFIAVDEASRFKESTAKRSLAFYGGRYEAPGVRVAYPPIFRNARHVVLMDGSPMPNRSMELWAPAFALHPEAIDCLGQNEFGYRYCGARPNERGVWEFLYSSNEAELQRKLRKDFMHVVTESELSHPERRRSMLFVDDDLSSPDYREWSRRHLPTRDWNEEMSNGDIARFRKQVGLRKVDWVAKYVRGRLENKNESILLFAWHREVCERLAEALAKWSPGLIYGGVANENREHFFDLFQRKIIRLLILNTAAGGRGHNLQAADRAIFAEWSWTDETNKQCEKRASRKGSGKEFVRCEYIVAPGTLDEAVLSSVFTKEKRVRKVIG